MADNLTPKEEFLLNPVTEHNITDAAIASFETNFKHPLKVTVPITSTQDLHDMPNPYPAGASVNLIPDGTNTENGYVAGQYLVTDGTTTANTNYYVSEYFQISENTIYTWSNRVNTSVSPAICFYDENKTFISGININGQYSQTFTSPVGAVYCRSSQTKYTFQEASSVNAAFQLEIGETATAYRRYSNICPINGISNYNIIGLNGYNFIPDDVNFVNGQWKPTGGSISASVYDVFYFRVPKGTLIWEVNIVGTPYICLMDEPIRLGAKTYNVMGRTNYLGGTLDNSAGHPYMAVFGIVGTGSTAHERVKSIGMRVSLGVSRSYSNPEKQTAIPITFTDPSTGDPMTIYGGTVTLNEDGSADLWSNYSLYTFDGNQNWKLEYPGESRWFFSYRSYQSFNNDVATQFANKYPVAPIGLSGAPASNQGVYITGDGWFRVRYGTEITLNEFKAQLAEEPLQVIVQTLSPTTYHFPNVGQLKAFLGQNNVWSDIGNVNVKYLTQNSQTGIEYRGDRALELRRRAMIADSPHIHTTVGSSATGGLASFKSYVKAPVKKIEIPFSPKQDFNGYNFPWPSGGYVQLFNSATTTYGSKIDVDGTLTEDANYFVSDFIPVTASTYYYVSGEMPIVVGYDSSQEFLQVIKNSGTGGAFQTPENCAYVRIQNYTEESDANTQASAAGTAYVCKGSEENQWYPYENICPIEGYDGCRVLDTNANILDPKALILKTFVGSSTYDSDTNALTISSNIKECGLLFSVKPNTLYTFGLHRVSGGTARFAIYEYSDVPTLKTDYVVVTREVQTVTGSPVVSITTSAQTKYACFYCIKDVAGSSASVIDKFWCSFGNTQNEYIPYYSQSLPLTFNQSGDHAFLPIQEGTGTPSPENVRPIHSGLTFTRDDDSVLSVYGGTLTVNADGSSSIVSEWISATLDANNVGEQLSAGRVGFGNVFSERLKWNAPSTEPICVCDRLNVAAYANSQVSGYDIVGVSGWKGVYVRIQDAATPSLVQEWLQNNPLSLLGKLETPVTYTLSVTETNRALEALGLTQHIGSLYGGTITINPDGSADVVREWAKTTVGNLSWSYYNTLMYATLSSKVIDTQGQLSNIISDQYITTNPTDGAGSGGIFTNNTIRGNYISKYIYIKDTRYTSAGTFKSAQANVEIVYKLATPQTYHFSNLEQLKVWLGENNFWCDISDDITVKYLNRG